MQEDSGANAFLRAVTVSGGGGESAGKDPKGWSGHEAFFITAPDGGAARTVPEGQVLIADVVEEVHLVLAREQRRADAVDGCVAPALLEPRG